jgi:heptosyltransferase II
VRVKLFKYADAGIGRIVARLLPSPKRDLNLIDVPVSRILIIRPGGIGDAVLLVPALCKLHQIYPHASIHVLAETRNAAVFDLAEGVEKVYCYDIPSQLLRAIRNQYDVVIDTEQWHRLSAVVARLTRSPVLIGFGTNDRKRLFTHPVPYSHDDYEVDSFLHLLTPLVDNGGWDRALPFLTVRPDVNSIATQVLEPGRTEIIVALFPGSSIRERQWGTHRFQKTARLLSSRGYSIIAVGGGTDQRAGEVIVEDLPHSLNLCGQLSLPETAAVLRRCNLLITGDSGIMHIGYGLGIKIVALFGPGREKKWAPQGPTVRVINKHLACSPCTSFGYTPRCTRNEACLQDITPEEVVQESMTLLGPGV